MSTQENYDDLDFDPVALREKYRLERDKKTTRRWQRAIHRS